MPTSPEAALREVAIRILERARETGNISLKDREDLAEALGHPREAAHGHHTKPQPLYDFRVARG